MARQEGWLLALGGLLLSALFSFGLFLTSCLFFRSYALSHALLSAYESRFLQAAQYLNFSENAHNLISTVPWIIQSSHFQPLRSLFSLGVTLSKRDPEALRQNLEDLHDDPVIESIKTDLQKILPLLDEARAARKMQNIPSETKDHITGSYSSLKKDLSSLLSLPASLDAPFTFYPDGVLKDLPVLDQIPKSPRTLPELRTKLEQFGGKVVIPQGISDPRMYFTSKIEELQRSATTLKTEMQSLGLLQQTPLQTALGSALEITLQDRERAIFNKILLISRNLQEQ